MANLPTPNTLGSRSEQIREGWDAIAEEWDSWASTVEAWFRPATRVLLELLGLKPGDRVLELAAGSGGLTLHLASAVGPQGRVVATDSGPNMVKLVARNARSLGLNNVVARVMDGEAPDVPWASMDAVACRQGFMFFADPGTVLGRLSRVLRPGGRIGLTVFSTPERNGLMSTPTSILSRWRRSDDATRLPTDGPGPFSLSVPGLLESLLEDAGFTERNTRTVSCPLRLSLTELLKFYHDVLGDFISDLPVGAQEQAWDEVGRACRDYAGPGSEGAPCELLVAVGRRPSLDSAVER